ncbi:hypothetical protein MCP1_40113 [Candidatus Terasakiella magnetica]|nr:hypothetical protein MCP1_40113 [Candidatus Terasakiella magnetica]
MAAETVIAAIRRIYEQFDALAETLPKEITVEGEVRALACKVGCTACCHQSVNVTAGQVMVVKAYILRHLKGDLPKIASRLRHTRKGLGETMGAVGVRCPLLDQEGGCTVYEARPLSCRAFNSFDRGACEASFLGQDEKRQSVTLSKLLTLRSDATKAILQTELAAGIAAFRQHRINAEGQIPNFELVRSLTTALQDDDFEQKCMGGQVLLQDLKR